jgi:hypothetical protein
MVAFHRHSVLRCVDAVAQHDTVVRPSDNLGVHRHHRQLFGVTWQRLVSQSDLEGGDDVSVSQLPVSVTVRKQTDGSEATAA